jgi:parallel beta helix pectate lyase-like protein
MRFPVRTVLILILAIVLLTSQDSPPATAAPGVTAGLPTGACDLYAAPSGSDTANGSLAAPFKTVQRLVGSLSPGQTGCLRAGDYAAQEAEKDGFRQLKIATPNVTLTSAPGEEAEIEGRLWIAAGADGVAVERLSLEGANSHELPSPTVDADETVFNHDDVTNDHTGICFILGDYEYEVAHRTVIENSRIHDCGESSSNQQHGIYVSSAVGTAILRNWIYDNASRGIQLYPDAQSTTIAGNVIYGNGEGIIFSGNDKTAASGTTVVHNTIAGSTVRGNVESYYDSGAPIGADNVVADNCIYGAASSYYRGPDDSGLLQPEIGFHASNNLTQNPRLADPLHGDLEPAAQSACASVVEASHPTRQLVARRAAVPALGDAVAAASAARN